ncbi:Os02g0575950 [Oryza sativa Japonica Group]|uniref:Os02g0575950 protein n=1 Tax=Oryza sativa subsp. japonica TaxID=39947 RepID=A0A0P0VKW7_ORYSJ|nr:Os02g0575950 [Oryza sativa Japonica Group]
MATTWRWQRGGPEWAASAAMDGHRDGIGRLMRATASRRLGRQRRRPMRRRHGQANAAVVGRLVTAECASLHAEAD